MGYAGGKKPDPSYYNLGDHTESLQVDFDPLVVSYGELLAEFWKGHDPFAMSFRRQYASILFFHDPDQEQTDLEQAAELEKKSGRKVRTEIRKLERFYPAEDYHQKFALKGTPAIYDEFRGLFPREEDLVASTAAARANGYLGGYGTLEQLDQDLPMLGLSSESQKLLRELFLSR
ncbi:MAG: Peptide methionine sulfoxide reductase MsrA [Synergistales bacterium 58_81]|nr:MAG: Peptide methionine sulfoxide reductase MsrA [Synergistales bacterium 57_84]KUK88779.1 MAG: Peptide methionine sulfoxide reductase MsrA [Synergistales bacterium 58_81]